jgi:ADP-ribose pyrophosphatase
MIEDAAESWPVVASQPLLKNWLISVRSDTVRLPDNSQAERTVVTHPGAVAILALDEAQRVLMIRQYRHPVGRELWEIPAGLRDADGESPLQTAQRELLEETGYRASEWHTLIDYYGSPGFSTEELRVFLARGVERGDSGYHREAEEKYIVTDWVPLTEATRLALAGKLHSGPAIAGVLAGYVASTQGFAGLRPATAPVA